MRHSKHFCLCWCMQIWDMVHDKEQQINDLRVPNVKI